MGDRTRAAAAEVTVGARPELGRWRCAKYGTTEGCFADRFSIDVAVRDPSLRRMTLNLSIPSSVFLDFREQACSRSYRTGPPPLNPGFAVVRHPAGSALVSTISGARVRKCIGWKGMKASSSWPSPMYRASPILGTSRFNGRLCALHEEVTDPYRILCSKISVPRGAEYAYSPDRL